jgi:transcription elongation factor GreA
VRDKPISFEEKTFNKFKAHKSFFDRVQTLRDFLEHAEPDSDYFAEMFSYFTGFLKSSGGVNELVLSSFMLVQQLASIYPHLNPGLESTFADLIKEIENIEELFSKIDDHELKKVFLVQLHQHYGEWSSVYARLFLTYQSKFIIDELVREKKWDTLKGLTDQVLGRNKEHREAFVWLARNLLDESWFARMELNGEKLLIGMIHLLDITFREINNKRDVSYNRKINKQIQDFLFKEKKLLNHILETGEESITRLYTLIDDVRELDPSIRISLKQHIKTSFPKYEFFGDHEKETVSMGLLTTRSSYESKQMELREIIENQIPQNSTEIGVAMDKGDLRENAEYKAALERQELLKSSAIRIQEELQKAQIFDESQMSTDEVSFGTKVKLKNLLENSKEEYTILGPWESNPAKNIISYRSPLGAELMNHKTGDKLNFTISDQNFKYQVEGIESVILTGG